MDNTIDTLSLEIKSNANSAVGAIDRLAASLLKLQTSLGGIDSSMFANLSNGIRQMSDSVMNFSQSVKTADFTRIANGLNRIAGINVQGLSDASQSISTLASNLNGIGTIQFDSQGIANLANSIAQLGRKTVTQAAENIPKLTTALSGLVTELNTLGTVNFDAASLSNLVSSITRLGGKAATNAIPNIKSLGIALKEMMAILATAPNVSQNLIQMTQALAQLAANGGRVSSASGSLINSLNGVGSAASRTKKHVFSLAAAFGKFYATYWLILRGFRMFKKAIDISSDLTEVQNVVDVTFGDMAQKVEDLSKVSIKDFGMSELTAKQISSRFQAMGVAMGFSQEKMSDMSIELTKLAADMASFYNVDQEAVAESLSAIFTGQTRPLRQYGLDLTQATLQEWAMKQGIDANMKSMSQAEKTLLRYNYVLANTTAAQNDFSRTSGTWANQVRILAQSFEQLGSIIGGALINTFKPLIAWLNRAMQSIISFAQTVVNALGKIFGWTYEIKGGGIANDFEDAGIGAEEMADGTGKAKDNLEEMQKYIAAWHEVNNMTTKDDNDGGGKGAGGGLGDMAGGALAGQLVRTEGLFEKYKSDIDSLYELGEYIGKVLTDAMNSINWDKVYEKARNFGKGLADFLNGLISPELFGAVGRTIAGALNTAIYAALAFGERFDWKDFGKSIAAGINEFFKTFDFSSLAKTINVWAKGILNTIITAIDITDWGMIGKQIGTFLADIDIFSILMKVGKAIWKGINAAFDLYSSTFSVAPFETALLTLIAVPKLFKVEKFKKIIGLFSSGFTIIGKFFEALSGGQGIIGALMVSFPKLGKVISVFNESLMYVITGMRTMGSGGLLSGISAGFANISKNLTASQKGFVGVFAAFAEFKVIKNSMAGLVQGTENIVAGILKIVTAAGLAGVALSAVFSFPAGAIAAGIIALTGALFGVKSAIDDIVENDAGEIIANNLTNPNGKPISEITGEYVDMFKSISDGYEEVAEKSEQIEQVKKSAEETGKSIDTIKFAIENGAYTAEEKIPEIQNLFDQLLTDSKSIFTQEYDLIVTGLAGSLGEAAEAAGISIGEYMGHLNSLKTNVEQTYDEVTKSNRDLQTQYESGKISVEEYYAGLEENREKLSKITIETDQFKESIDSVSKSAKDVDFSEFINADNSFNATGFSDKLNTVAKSANDAKDSINNSGEEMTKTLENMQTRFSEFGDSIASERTAELINLQANSIAEGVENVDGELINLGDTIQLQLLEKIPGIVEDASIKWEQNRNESLWFRLFGPDKETYVKSEVEEYKTGFIDPALGEIQSMYEQAGIDASTWAGDAIKPAVDSMFDTTTTYMAEGIPETTTKVRNNYKEIFLNALQDIFDSEMESRAGELGKDIDSGVEKGVKDNVDLVKNAMSEIGDAAETGARDSLESHSPSRRMMPVGKDVLLGIVEGFTASFNEWTSSITTWATDTYNLFSSSITKTVSDAVGWFSQLPEKAYNAIIGFVTQTLPRWKSNVDGFFMSAIPNITSLVTSLFSNIGNNLIPAGENIVRGLWQGIANLTGWIGQNIAQFCNNVLNIFKVGFDIHSPSKEAFKIGDYFGLGLQNGITERFSDIYGDIVSFTKNISSLKINVPELDYSIPTMEDYTPKIGDMSAIQSRIQMEIDEKMAQMAYENRQLQKAVEQNTQILEQILAQGIVLDDNNFTRRYKSASSKFYKQYHYEMGLFPAGG